MPCTDRMSSLKLQILQFLLQHLRDDEIAGATRLLHLRTTVRPLGLTTKGELSLVSDEFSKHEDLRLPCAASPTNTTRLPAHVGCLGKAYVGCLSGTSVSSIILWIAGSCQDAWRFWSSRLTASSSGFAAGCFCSDLDHQNAISPAGSVASPRMCSSVAGVSPVVNGVYPKKPFDPKVM